jgi:hypothetical protein
MDPRLREDDAGGVSKVEHQLLPHPRRHPGRSGAETRAPFRQSVDCDPESGCMDLLLREDDAAEWDKLGEQLALGHRGGRVSEQG